MADSPKNEITRRGFLAKLGWGAGAPSIGGASLNNAGAMSQLKYACAN